MCVLLHLLICTVLRAHIIIVEALYKINYYYYLLVWLHCVVWKVEGVCVCVCVCVCVHACVPVCACMCAKMVNFLHTSSSCSILLHLHIV